MQIIKDTAGREWTLSLTIGTAKRLKAAGVFDLEALANSKQPAKEILPLIETPYAVAAFWVAVTAKDREERKVSEEDFLDAIDGDTVEAARDAIVKEIADFFPNSRALMLAAMNRSKEIEAKKITQAIEKLTTATDEEITAMALSSGNPSTK
jgi:isopropylmalate/homocitrate/citramalate synthase